MNKQSETSHIVIITNRIRSTCIHTALVDKQHHASGSSRDISLQRQRRITDNTAGTGMLIYRQQEEKAVNINYEYDSVSYWNSGNLTIFLYCIDFKCLLSSRHTHYRYSVSISKDKYFSGSVGNHVQETHPHPQPSPAYQQRRVC